LLSAQRVTNGVAEAWLEWADSKTLACWMVVADCFD
jgi:hypothetical protein